MIRITKYACKKLSLIPFLINSYCISTSLLTAPSTSDQSSYSNENKGLAHSKSSTLKTDALSSSSGPNTLAFSEKKIGSSGNWMKKRKWLMDALDVEEQIESLLTNVIKVQPIFDEKYEKINKEISSFYETIGLSRGKLQDLIGSLTRYLEKQKKAQESRLKDKHLQSFDIQNEVSKIEENLKEKNEQVQNLQTALQEIEELDKGLKERLKKANSLCTQAQQKGTQAESIIQDLWHVIDDKIAKSMYFQLKNEFHAQLASILAYLEKDLLQDFDKLILNIRQQIETTTNQINVLEADGLIIRDRINRIAQLKQKQLEAKLTTTPDTKQVISQPKKSEFSFIQNIKKTLISFFTTLWMRLKGLFSK